MPANHSITNVLSPNSPWRTKTAIAPNSAVEKGVVLIGDFCYSLWQYKIEAELCKAKFWIHCFKHINREKLSNVNIDIFFRKRNIWKTLVLSQSTIWILVKTVIISGCHLERYEVVISFTVNAIWWKMISSPFFSQKSLSWYLLYHICVINTNVNSQMHGYILKEQLDIKMMSFCILDAM